MHKLAIVTTHPIQYFAPWFKLLAREKDVTLKVFYTWSQSQAGSKYDPGFRKVIEWDIPLLDGYNYEFVHNTAKDPGSHHYNGIINPTLNSKIENFQPDAIMVIGWPFKSHFACMRYFKGKVPVLFRGDSTLLDETPGLKKLKRRVLLRYVYSFVDYALYVGTNNKNYYLVHGLKERQLFFVPHAIDNNRFGNNTAEFTEKANDWKNKLGINNDHIVILFAGKLEPKKHPDFILQLAETLPSEKYRFILVGNGPLEDFLKEKGKKDKRILFLDFQNQQTMPVIYHMADVFILPSKGPEETWGLAINEAMACGRAVMASTKTGCAVDLIVPGKNGYIINEDVSEAAFRIEEMRKNNLFEAMGKESKKLIQSYSFSAIVKNTVLFLNKLYHRA